MAVSPLPVTACCFAPYAPYSLRLYSLPHTTLRTDVATKIPGLATAYLRTADTHTRPCRMQLAFWIGSWIG